MGLFSRECPRCMRVKGACICSRATKVTTKGLKPAKPRRAAPAVDRSPHRCTEVHADGTSCPSIVRGGVCPCRHCP